MQYVGNILYDDKLLDKANKLIIFGSGIHGNKVLEYLVLNGVKDNIICFCDSDSRLQGKNILGIPIYLTKYVLDKYSDAEYLISGKYSREMYRILKEAGIDRVHILI